MNIFLIKGQTNSKPWCMFQGRDALPLFIYGIIAAVLVLFLLATIILCGRRILRNQKLARQLALQYMETAQAREEEIRVHEVKKP
jgi:hypothetical protein